MDRLKKILNKKKINYYQINLRVFVLHFIKLTEKKCKVLKNNKKMLKMTFLNLLHFMANPRKRYKNILKINQTILVNYKKQNNS